MNQHRKILRLVELAVLLAVLLLLEVTGLGMLKTFGLELTIMQLPVIIGAVVIGPGGGAALGLAFGLISFWECFGKSAFGVALLSINPFLTFLVCVPTRTLMGYLCGLIFRGLHGLTRGKKTDLLSYLGASLSGALLNTALFMGTLCACFYRTEYIQAFAAQLGAGNVFVFIALFVGVQGLVEAGLCTVVGTVVSRGTHRALHRA